MPKKQDTNWLDKLKTRHVIFITAIIILYAIFKAYVLYTPSPHDDDIPDKLRDAVLLMVDNEYIDPDDPLNKGVPVNA